MANIPFLNNATFSGTIDSGAITSTGNIRIARSGVHPAFILNVTGIANTTNASVRLGIVGIDNGGLSIRDETNSTDWIRAHPNGSVSIPSGALIIAAKATSASTVVADSGTTLTTKDYVEAFVPPTSTATSLWNLLPSARVSYSWVVTLTDGVWATVFEGADELSSGSWLVSVNVNDYAVGGTQYNETYTGTMSWISSGTNESSSGGISDIILHRNGHAANSGAFYLRTRETPSATDGWLKLEGMVNRTYSANSTISFKFIKAF